MCKLKVNKSILEFVCFFFYFFIGFLSSIAISLYSITITGLTACFVNETSLTLEEGGYFSSFFGQGKLFALFPARFVTNFIFCGKTGLLLFIQREGSHRGFLPRLVKTTQYLLILSRLRSASDLKNQEEKILSILDLYRRLLCNRPKSGPQPLKIVSPSE